MRSTKKVAPVAVLKAFKTASHAKQKAVLKKTSSPKKASVKVSKVQSAGSLRLSKIVITNRSSKPVKNFRTQKSVQTKLRNSPLLSKKNLPVKKKTFLQTDLNTPIKSPIKSLAILSSYRFPIEPKTVAIGMARYGGLFFVIVGAFFTVFFANASFNFHSQKAELIDTTTGIISSVTGGITSSLTGSGSNGSSDGHSSTSSGSGSNSNSGSGSNSGSSTSVNCNDPLQYLSSTCSSQVDHTPGTTFDSSSSGVLSGNVRVRVNVAHAQSVTLSAYNSTLHQDFKIGSMSLNSDPTWELYWDTTKFPDGNYTLEALVSNGYGSYQRNGTVSLVENNPITSVITTVSSTTSSVEHAITTDNSSNSTSTTSTVTVATNNTVVLATDKKTSSTEFNFSITVPTIVTSVKMYAVLKGTNNNVLIGYAYKSNGAEWKYKWSASSVNVGEYTVTALALSGSSQVTSNQVSVTKTSSAVINIATSTTQIIPLNSTPLATTTAKATNVAPTVSVDVQSSSPLSGIVPVKVSVKGASTVELYIQKRYSLTRTYLGKALAVDTGVWMYQWDTKQTPNAEFAVVAVVTNTYGTYEGQSNFVTVKNSTEVTLTSTQENRVQTLKAIAADVKSQASLSSSTTSSVASTSHDTQVLFTGEDNVKTVLSTYQDKVNNNLDALATALRMNDQSAVDAAKKSLTDTKAEIISNNPDIANTPAATQLIDTTINNNIDRVTNDVKVVDSIITQRTNSAASLDSDHDGISDYDEVNIYHTNAYVADTDGDGFTDGAEILAGYDPLDPKSQAPVAYESPKDAGIVREDILKVSSITTASKTSDSSTSSSPVALISGKALPNSFVTLYIFSTPIVVTVKTDTDGNWNYRFDKELDNGNHQVYVGITDNAGQIVAKSQPFSFVKEAQAYSPSDPVNATAPAPSSEQRPSFLSEYMIYLVISISVVAIGLVLIMLGLHLDARGRKIIVLPDEAEVTV